MTLKEIKNLLEREFPGHAVKCEINVYANHAPDDKHPKSPVWLYSHPNCASGFGFTIEEAIQSLKADLRNAGKIVEPGNDLSIEDISEPDVVLD